MPVRDATRLLSLVALAAFTVGCGSSEPARQHLHDPGRPDTQQMAALKAAEQAYRKKDAGFAAQRDALAQEPVTAFWLTRMLIDWTLKARDPREISEKQKLGSAADVRDAAENRAMDQIVAMGPAAVPCVVEDLMKNKAADRRELGVELIGRIGTVALPEVTPLLTESEGRLRRTGMRAVAAMPPSPQTRELLLRGAADADFGVRGEAVRGLGPGGPAEAALLHKALVQDEDPFVRRSAAQALGTFRDQESARLLIEYLERCYRERESLGQQAAQASLQSLSGMKGQRTPEAWRSWLQQWRPEAAK